MKSLLKMSGHHGKKHKKHLHTVLLFLCVAVLCTGAEMYMDHSPFGLFTWITQKAEVFWQNVLDASQPEGSYADDLSALPDYNGSPYVIINNNVPYFKDEELTTEPFETYHSLDILGRCGPAYACVGRELMPTDKRESISEVKPSGWHSAKYDFIDQEFLYNRCHLIGFQLTGENANEENLITGTRYLNVEGMLPFENKVAEYIRKTGNHVLYRVTPIFEGGNLLASGVLMEAQSVEDNGYGVMFNVYIYNVQPGVEIDYGTGESWPDENREARNAAAIGLYETIV